MRTGRGLLVWTSGSLAVGGGILMVVSGYASRGFLLTALNLAETQLSQYLGGIAGLTVSLAVSAVALLIALGGLTVIFGGVALLAGHRTTGRLLIMLGGSAGFLGLLLTFGYAVLKLGPSAAIEHLTYWLGLVLAIVGRRLAKGI